MRIFALVMCLFCAVGFPAVAESPAPLDTPVGVSAPPPTNTGVLQAGDFASSSLETGEPSIALGMTNLVAPALIVKPPALPRLPEPRSGQVMWKVSLAALVAAHAVDAATSWKKRELNPVLSPGQGSFGWQTLTIKGSLAVVAITLQAFTLRRHPEFAKRIATLNFVQAGVIGGVAAHNATIPRQ